MASKNARIHNMFKTHIADTIDDETIEGRQVYIDMTFASKDALVEEFMSFMDGIMVPEMYNVKNRDQCRVLAEAIAESLNGWDKLLDDLRFQYNWHGK